MAKILIVEDEEDLVAALAFNLKKEGHTVAHAARGDLALNATLREQPDLILLDLMLPGLNGRDVCRTLREKGIDVPIIMLTARNDEARPGARARARRRRLRHQALQRPRAPRADQRAAAPRPSRESSGHSASTDSVP